MIENKNVLRRYGIPEEVKFCARCTMSNQRPRVVFDAEGVCPACRFSEYKEKKIDWDLREKELAELCDQHRRRDGGYDIIAPASGGKDSAFVAHQLKYKYGMNPLTVTWSPHLYTEIGFQNLQAFVHQGGFDNILGTPNGIVHRKLTRIAFEEVGDPFLPFIYGQTNFPHVVAAKYDVPIIMFGENGDAEYGGNMDGADRSFRYYFTEQRPFAFSGLPPEEMVKYGVGEKDLTPYMPPSRQEMENQKIQMHFFSYYRKWVPQEHYYYAVEHTGFKPNSERNEGTYSKYASLDDKLDGFHYYLMFIKFGIGRATSDTAHEIRDGHLTREEGVNLVRKYDGEFPRKYFKVFLDYCGMTEEHFWEVIDSWRSPHLWEKDGKGWALKHQVS